jgi:putative membrane protein
MMAERGPAHAPSAHYRLSLLAVFATVFVVLGIAPLSREDWLLENALVVLALAWLIGDARRGRPLSNLACTLVFAFGLFHEIGAHYTYSQVPYEAWFGTLSGGRSLDALLGFERNQYDRLVHFLYGLLVTPVAAEVLVGRVPLRGGWRFVLPLTFMMSHAVAYELIEWGAASALGGALGEAYLGTQGDVWDAQKDMALATLGSLLALPVWLWCRRGGAQAVRAPT